MGGGGDRTGLGQTSGEIPDGETKGRPHRFYYSILVGCLPPIIQYVGIGLGETSCPDRWSRSNFVVLPLFSSDTYIGRCILSPKLTAMHYVRARCTAARTRRNLTQMSVTTRSRSHSRGLAFSWTPGPVPSSSTRCSTPLCTLSVFHPPPSPISILPSTAAPANDLLTEPAMQNECIDDEGIGHSRPSQAPLQRRRHALR